MFSQAIINLNNIRESGQASTLGERMIGLEKECLRVSESGGISQRQHPKALGSALAHPSITTDYSEALLEIVTPPFKDIRQTLDYLCEHQRFIYSELEDDEFLWATSMPCVLTGDSAIKVAQYGSSNAGQMKTIYRDGLGLRYGKTMQVIAGVHFNFSFSESFWDMYQQTHNNTDNKTDFISDQYFHLIRNLLRHGWVIPYLFGASPAVCKTFLGDGPIPPNMEVFNSTTYFEPYGTSLRMGDIGYQNKKEGDAGIQADYSNVNAYSESLYNALISPHEEFAALGLKKDGVHQQLNTNLLQIENEYYSSVRPKQIPEGDELPILALMRRGVRYVELRSLDVNAYEPLGINESQVRFVETMMLFCLCAESPNISDAERTNIDHNLNLVAHRGREPGLTLNTICSRGEVPLKDLGANFLDNMTPFAELLDEVNGGDLYMQALNTQKEKFQNPDLTPSARMLAEMHETDEAFFNLAFRKSQEHLKFFQENKLSEERRQAFKAAAEASLKVQQEKEGSEQLSMDDYLEKYFSQLNAAEFKAFDK